MLEKTTPESECQFEIVFNSENLKQKIHKFQANTKRERDEWVIALQDRVQFLLNQQNSETEISRPQKSSFTLSEDQKKALFEVPGNDACADCRRSSPGSNIFDFHLQRS